MHRSQSLLVLLVEDDIGDQTLIRHALQSQPIKVSLHAVGRGEDALDYLHCGIAGNTECPEPDLILLDLNMPGMDGKQFLKLVKSDERLSAIPIVVLTTSDSEADIHECYKLHAAGYIQKPGSIAKLREILKTTMKYWFENSGLIKSCADAGNKPVNAATCRKYDNDPEGANNGDL